MLTWASNAALDLGEWGASSLLTEELELPQTPRDLPLRTLSMEAIEGVLAVWEQIIDQEQCRISCPAAFQFRLRLGYDKPMVKDGHIQLSDRPGFGIELNEELIKKKYLVEGEQ